MPTIVEYQIMLRPNRSLDRMHAKISAMVVRTETVNSAATRSLGAATKQRNTPLANVNKIRGPNLVRRCESVKEICESVNPVVSSVGDITD